MARSFYLLKILFNNPGLAGQSSSGCGGSGSDGLFTHPHSPLSHGHLV